MPICARHVIEKLGRWPRTFVTPQPLSVLFLALAAHYSFMDESCCKATSILLVGSVAAWGEEPALPSLSPCPYLSRPQRRAVCKAPHGTQLKLGKGRVLGKAAEVM